MTQIASGWVFRLDWRTYDFSIVPVDSFTGPEEPDLDAAEA